MVNVILYSLIITLPQLEENPFIWNVAVEALPNNKSI